MGGYAWWVAGLAHFTWPALLAVLGGGGLAVVAGRLRSRREARPPLGVRDLRPWLVVLGLLLAWELLAYSLSPRDDHPTLSSIADTVLSPRPLEAAAFVAWLAAGRRLARP